MINGDVISFYFYVEKIKISFSKNVVRRVPIQGYPNYIFNDSKKDITIRRNELLDFVSEDLLAIVAAETENLMRDPLAIQVVQEIIFNAKADKTKAVDAVVSLTSGNPVEENHIIKLPFTARVYKTLVQGGHYNAKEGKVECKTSQDVINNSGRSTP